MSSTLFGNGTDIVHWKPSPTTRGTFDILTTCIITMLLCVWTAVHLNVPPPGSVWGPRLRKVGWLILALLAPEMVAYTAWYQRQQALNVMRTINEAFVLPNPPSWHEKARKSIAKAVTEFRTVFVHRKEEAIRQPTLEAQRYSLPDDRHPWTIVHGFYAVMGGIAFEIPDNIPESKKFLPSHRREIPFLTESLIRSLLNSDHKELLPDFSEEEIQAKSKANGLAKSLVCIQALWFIAQCITRLAQKIPISLLELNTFGHAVCALLIYLLWWEKPFEVDYPGMVEGQILWDLYALSWMEKNRSPAIESYSRDVTAYLARDKWFQSLPHDMKEDIVNFLNSRSDIEMLDINAALENPTGDCENLTQEIELDRDNEAGSTILMPGQTLKGTRFKIPGLEDILYNYAYKFEGSIDLYTELRPPYPHISLTTEDITRYKMALRALEFWYSDTKGPRPAYRWVGLHRSYLIPTTFCQRCKDWPAIANILELPVGLGFTTAGLIYGGLHALAWFAYFESSTQQLLWRISACVVMGGFPVLWVLMKSVEKFEDTPMYHRGEDNIFLMFMFIAAASVLGTYMLARAYLVVECFINLSHLPAGVYDVPIWASYFPHIS